MVDEAFASSSAGRRHSLLAHVRMASKLTVIFYIILCLEAGIILTVAPWTRLFGMGDWGDNFFLVYAAQQIGIQGLQQAVASGWVRGAVTGLGLLNLAMAFWEMFHFRETVRRLQGADMRSTRSSQARAEGLRDGVRRDPTTDNLFDNERRDR